MKSLKEQSRKSMEAKVKAHGGSVKSHSDVKEDKALVKKMVKPVALTGKAHGGKASAKHGPKAGGAKVNVVIAPHGGDGAPGAVPPGGAGPSGAMPSRPMVPPAAPGLAELGAPRPAGFKAGGRTKRADGGRVGKFEAGAGSGEGRLEKTEHAKKRAK